MVMVGTQELPGLLSSVQVIITPVVRSQAAKFHLILRDIPALNQNFPFPVLWFLTSLRSQEFPRFPVWLCQLLGCTQQAYKVSTCPASRPKKGPRVSNRDIKGLMDWGAYTSKERSYINTTPQDMVTVSTLVFPGLRQVSLSLYFFTS